ncbi:YraN family protein [Actinomyces bowdenii]|uniref:YraN family protein n=1 Tax=Actinomyces bowdenii TaxID=131109 RepID=UPI003C7A19D9
MIIVPLPIAVTADPRSAERARTGRHGEDLAAAYLSDIGWQVLDRNWRPGRGMRGELDLIALEATPRSARPVLVVIEVKTRRSLRQGPPAAAVDGRKLARLRALAAAWAAAHRVAHSWLRIDVISVLLPEEGPAQLRHHRGVGL